MSGYREIADSLRARIRAGEFPAGARLPSISALQAAYGGPALNTVRAAQQVLVQEGLLATHRGVGAFVNGTGLPDGTGLPNDSGPPNDKQPDADVDLVAALRSAGEAVQQALGALEGRSRPQGQDPVGRLPAAPGDAEGAQQGTSGREAGGEPALPAGNAAAPGGRRTQLLSAACRIIARRGVRGLRVAEVAEQAGVSTALIYHHFGNRSGLVTAVMLHINDRLATRAAAGSGSGLERLLRRMRSEFGADERTRENSAVWGEVRGAAVFDEQLRPIIDDATEHWIGQLAALLEQGKADGSIPSAVDTRAAAVRCTAMVEGLSNRWLAGALDTGAACAHVTAAVHAELALAVD